MNNVEPSWLGQALKGNTEAFTQLVEAYQSPVYNLCYRMLGDAYEAEDAAQETFLRAWKALDNLNDTGAAKSWLITILRREYARTFERKVPKFTDVDTVVVPDDGELEPDARAEIDLLRRNIMKLPIKYREPLLLQAVLGCSCEEIAAELGISRSAVMTQLFRAREQLKAQLEQAGGAGNVHGLF